MRNFFWLAALLVASLTACSDSEKGGNEPPENKRPELNCTSENPLNFPEEGGTGVITYTLKNPLPEGEVLITENADWIEEAKVSSAGRITFLVEANSGEARSTTILVSYESTSFSVKVNQEAASNDNPEIGSDYDVELTLHYASGSYYGTMHSTNYNYYIFLSDNGLDSENYMLENSCYYILDLYSNLSPSNPSKIQVPTGTYRFDPSDSAAAGSIGASYSYYAITGTGEAYEELTYSDATLEVKSDGSMELFATLQDGSTHHILFSGDYSLPEYKEEGGGSSGSDGYYSNLTGDKSANLSQCMGYAEWYGDYYECGGGNWVITLEREMGEGDAITFDLICKGTAMNNDFSGEYEATPILEATIGDFVTGYLEEFYGEYYIVGSWYYNNTTEEMAPIYDGTLSIARSGDQYTISFDCIDDAPEAHAIRGSWSGVFDLSDESEIYSTTPLRRSARSLSPRIVPRPTAKERLVLRR
uniref:BACON domain-containing protein n=1 Tax=Alistipes sp. TaxID=1872444 RepID=UPI004057417E